MGEFKGVTWGEGKVQGGIWFIHLEYFGIFYGRLGNDVLYIEGYILKAGALDTALMGLP